MGIGRFFRRSAWDDERARELEAHLQIEIDEQIARGLPPDRARDAARRKLGNTMRVREEIYEMNTVAWLDAAWRDLRYGARMLAANRSFTIVALLSLALGVGANTAIFQLVDAVRLRLLPVRHPEQLVEIRITDTHEEGRTGSFLGSRPSLTYPLVEAIRREQQAFSGLAVVGRTMFDLSSGGETRNADGLWISGDFFSTLGVQPVLGRLIAPADDVRGCTPGVVISYAFWEREFGGQPAALSRTVSLDGRPFPVLGVTPPTFFGIEVGRTFDVAVPICAEPLLRIRAAVNQSDYWWLAAFGRLKPGWTRDRADAHLAAIGPGLLRSTLPSRYSPKDAASYLRFRIGADPAGAGISSLRRDYEAPLWLLLATTGVVLLIACANLANLMLARATARERELAVRLAIGASRSRLIRQMLAESVLLAAAGAMAGAFVAQWLSRFLVGFIRTGSNRLFLDLETDWRVFAFTAAIGVATALLFGLAPALRATRTPPADAMRGSRVTDTHERFGLRRSLVVVQVALSLVLVVGAILFVRTLRNLAAVEPGFDAHNVLQVRADLRRAAIPEKRRLAAYQEITDRIASLPGVASAAQATNVPMGGNFWNERVIVDGVATSGATNFNQVSPGYFRTLRTRMLAGRDFDAHDDASAPRVAIVTLAFVKKHLGGGPALGRTFQVDTPPGEPRPLITIVGVVEDSKYAALREAFDPLVYLASAQDPENPAEFGLVVRTDGPLQPITSAITSILTSTDPTIAVEYRPMETVIHESLIGERLMATLSGLFGGLAALIAMVGLYGVMSYMVLRRRSEIGIRLALGADRGEVVRMILREAGRLLGAGLVVGAALSAIAGRAASALLYGLKPWDPVTVVAAMAGLALVALGASYLPARQASRVEPTVALRAD